MLCQAERSLILAVKIFRLPENCSVRIPTPLLPPKAMPVIWPGLETGDIVIRADAEVPYG